MSKEVWSDIRVSFFSTVFNAFLLWLSHRDWSVTASVLTLAIIGTLAWYLLKGRNLERMESSTRKPAPQTGRPSLDLGSLIRLGAGVVAIGMTLYAGWSGFERVRVQRIEHGFSWRAREFWRAQCLGMKTVQITGMTAKNVLQYAPTMSKLPHEAMMGERRQAIYELQENRIIRNDIPPEQVQPGVIVQTTETTPLGRTLCTYYLTAYSTPKLAEPTNKAQ